MAQTRRIGLSLNPESNQLDALLVAKLECSHIAAASLIKILLINHFANNGGLCLAEEEQIKFAEIFPRGANKKEIKENKPKRGLSKRHVKGTTAAVSDPIEVAAEQPPVIKKPPAMEDFYKDLMDAQF